MLVVGSGRWRPTLPCTRTGRPRPFREVCEPPGAPDNVPLQSDTSTKVLWGRDVHPSNGSPRFGQDLSWLRYSSSPACPQASLLVMAMAINIFGSGFCLCKACTCTFAKGMSG